MYGWPWKKLAATSGTNITVGQWTEFDHKWHVTEHVVSQSGKMTGRKRPAAWALEHLSSSGSTANKAKCQLTISTFEKWQCDYDKEHQTLECNADTQHRDLIGVLWCSACREYKSKTCCINNYSEPWVIGSENHRTSTLLDHVVSNQHKVTMSHCCAVQARARQEPITSYAPICLLSVDAERGKMRWKFDLAVQLDKVGITFEKYPMLYELEARHDVDLGPAYKTAPSAKLFTHYITESQSLSMCM